MHFALTSSSALLHRRVVRVAVEIDEEHVVPFAPARRPRLDARHVHAVACERAEQVQQRAGALRAARRDQHRGLVVAARRKELAADDDEARRVVRLILDLAERGS